MSDQNDSTAPRSLASCGRRETPLMSCLSESTGGNDAMLQICNENSLQSFFLLLLIEKWAWMIQYNER